MSKNPEIPQQELETQRTVVIADRIKAAKTSTDERSRYFLARQHEQPDIAHLISAQFIAQEVKPQGFTGLVMEYLGDDSDGMEEADFKLFKKNSSPACVVS